MTYLILKTASICHAISVVALGEGIHPTPGAVNQTSWGDFVVAENSIFIHRLQCHSVACQRIVPISLTSDSRLSSDRTPHQN
jgi:hypothetical protein